MDFSVLLLGLILDYQVRIKAKINWIFNILGVVSRTQLCVIKKAIKFSLLLNIGIFYAGE